MLDKVHIEYVFSDLNKKIVNEECKDQITSEQKLVMWLRQFTRELKVSTDMIEQDIKKLNLQKVSLIQLIKDAAEFKEIEQAYKEFLDKISEKVSVFENQKIIAKKSETDLIRCIQNIFEESMIKLSEANFLVVVQPKKLTHRLT